MKNILAENLLRFGVKNLTESQKHALQLLTEQAMKISKGGAIVGTTKSATTNTDAVGKLKGAGATVNGTITSTGCIKKAAGADQTTFTVSKKSPAFAKAVNYLKIGDKVIQGSAPTSMIVTFIDLVNQEIEAAGNGIFAIGRALAASAKKKDYGLTSTSALIIAFGATNTNSVFFNVDSGFQDPQQRWVEGACASLIANKVVNPTGGGSMMDIINKGRAADPATALAINARPSISDGVTPEITSAWTTAVAIDVSTFAGNGANANTEASATPYAEKYSSNYLYKFIYGIGTKFKLYIKTKAAAFGVPESLLQPIYDLIDTRVNEEWKKRGEYDDLLTNRISFLFKYTVKGGSGGSVGATTTGGVVKGKEGGIGTIKAANPATTTPKQ